MQNLPLTGYVEGKDRALFSFPMYYPGAFWQIIENLGYHPWAPGAHT